MDWNKHEAELLEGQDARLFFQHPTNPIRSHKLQWNNTEDCVLRT